MVEEKTRLGSTPPSCHNKCNQCHPCMAVQVPSLTSQNGRVQPGLSRQGTINPLDYYDRSNCCNLIVMPKLRSERLFNSISLASNLVRIPLLFMPNCYMQQCWICYTYLRGYYLFHVYVRLVSNETNAFY